MPITGNPETVNIVKMGFYEQKTENELLLIERYQKVIFFSSFSLRNILLKLSKLLVLITNLVPMPLSISKTLQSLFQGPLLNIIPISEVIGGSSLQDRVSIGDSLIGGSVMKGRMSSLAIKEKLGSFGAFASFERERDSPKEGRREAISLDWISIVQRGGLGTGDGKAAFKELFPEEGEETFNRLEKFLRKV